jgi:hypothetical protein
MTAVKKTLKDFSELRPIEEKIALVARGIMQVAFKGVALDNFKPKPGTQVYRVWESGKLDARQQNAWQEFIDDVMTAEGLSGKVTGSYGEYTDRGSGEGVPIPRAKVNAQYKRLEALWACLSRAERALLTDLLQDHFQGRSALKLETIGLIRSGYSAKEPARVAGVVHIQILLDRLATLYRL